eukprot:GHVS01085702.1.p1 GENE.GHVS01085702.1~~GHVS01085702.1.p1  ORF type:complete len:554 (+),score=78.40 GHVS01085702.1:29-1690(+)
MHWFLSCLLFSSLCSVLGQLVVLQPRELAAEFLNGRIDGSTAVFGTPYYGERWAGNLVFIDNPGCNAEDYDLPDTVSPVDSNDSSRRLTEDEQRSLRSLQVSDAKEGLRTVVMLRRGICHFVTKVLVAEKKGAIAVVVVDSEGSMSRANDVKKIIMADDGWGDGVKIPSLLIGEVDGVVLIDKLSEGKKVIIELAWTVPKATPVHLDQWMSPAFADTNKFLKEFAPYAKELEHKLDYHPHYVVITLGRDFKEMCTDDSGKFCGWDPDKGMRTTGKEIMEETVRQLCLWETTKQLNTTDAQSGFYSREWWEYVGQFGDECPSKGSVDEDKKASLLLKMTEEKYEDVHTLGGTCSYRLMDKVGADINKAKQCYKHEFNSLLTRELVNKAWSSTAVMINSWRYSGPLEANQLMRTLCTGYETEPAQCKRMSVNRNELIREGILAAEGMEMWSVVLVSVTSVIVGIILAALLYWCCIQHCIRRNMRYSIMEEARRNQKDNNSYDVHQLSNAPTELPSSAPSLASLPNVCGSPIGAAPLGRQFSFEDAGGGRSKEAGN